MCWLVRFYFDEHIMMLHEFFQTIYDWWAHWKLLISFFGNKPDSKCEWNEISKERKKNYTWFEENRQNWIDKIESIKFGKNKKGQILFLKVPKLR